MARALNAVGRAVNGLVGENGVEVYAAGEEIRIRGAGRGASGGAARPDWWEVRAFPRWDEEREWVEIRVYPGPGETVPGGSEWFSPDDGAAYWSFTVPDEAGGGGPEALPVSVVVGYTFGPDGGWDEPMPALMASADVEWPEADVGRQFLLAEVSGAVDDPEVEQHTKGMLSVELPESVAPRQWEVRKIPTSGDVAVYAGAGELIPGASEWVQPAGEFWRLTPASLPSVVTFRWLKTTGWDSAPAVESGTPDTITYPDAEDGHKWVLATLTDGGEAEPDVRQMHEGPCVLHLNVFPPPPDTGVHLLVDRAGAVAWEELQTFVCPGGE